ncbi:hypothetical protein RSSM_00602 [Rhodopirellula sallentina SM41]|uniref:Uncharacterized protein n=1 Tax=Rhodopirellula sallentina SM41 TaxID=1263870 RepID=M5U918_9BACT|nr:hypothetical protein RSSM_00602 [Rhodopirellula sallentina SM41]
MPLALPKRTPKPACQPGLPEGIDRASLGPKQVVQPNVNAFRCQTRVA